jgi:methylated-DNA-protein-cysteine methyltransferase-like protein
MPPFSLSAKAQPPKFFSSLVVRPWSLASWFREQDFANDERPKTNDRFAMTQSRILATIRRIPRGKVSTYGAVARAAGYPRGARMVARALHGAYDVPWQRVLGAGGEIKLRGESALEQRFRLQAEGVTFRGRKVNMKLHEFKFKKTVVGR